jgi:hypothetical protein
LFGVIVGFIIFGGAPEYLAVVLYDSPRLTLADGLVGDASSAKVVGLEWCCWLGMSQGFYGDPKLFPIFCIMK